MREVLLWILIFVIIGALVVLAIVVPPLFERDDGTHTFPFGWMDSDGNGNGNGTERRVITSADREPEAAVAQMPACVWGGRPRGVCSSHEVACPHQRAQAQEISAQVGVCRGTHCLLSLARGTRSRRAGAAGQRHFRHARHARRRLVGVG